MRPGKRGAYSYDPFGNAGGHPPAGRDLRKCPGLYEKTGNPTQWGDDKPKTEWLIEDIGRQELYVCCDGDEVYGVFMLMFGPEPVYCSPIEGWWRNDAPYGTIHRIAARGTRKGVFDESINYCKSRIDNLRIDTHPNNKTMQHLCERSGFVRCGKILVTDCSPRIIYHWVREEERR